MKLRKSILTLLVLSVMGLFLAGGGCEGGQCPFKKIFGGKSAETKSPCPSETETAPPAESTK
jgi:hypothetical protein